MGGFSDADLTTFAELTTLDHYHAMLPDPSAARDREAYIRQAEEQRERLVSSVASVLAAAQFDPRFRLEVR